ncbi:AraC family transcriptional regulator [Terrimonas sp. NA20]|uniref:AraC family transcriptional regulator n=1 Tax=Terrimonas ginsenosidimutans TaxID=2908004 RepID=A0ABS9KSS5_9BACT|nr:helix-turn-helix domain-containing protein [Terrimonas ginsenosidimutans]MCG2615379.1 AraC family transcriptional regulator [Terrimonas ginsenosidimutans]
MEKTAAPGLHIVPANNQMCHCIQLFGESLFLDHFVQNKPFRSTQYLLIFIEQGSVTISVNGEQSIYPAGSLFLVCPSHQLHFTTSPGNCTMYILSYDEQSGEKLHLDFGCYKAYHAIFEKREIVSYAMEDPLRGYFTSMLHQLDYYLKIRHEDNFKIHIVSNIFSAIIYTMIDLMHENIDMEDHSYSRKEKIVMDFLDLVEKEFRNTKGIGQYAEKLHVSVQYLSICVRTVTQKTPSFFINHAVLTEAKALLLNTDHTLSAIADDLEFPDPFTFGKFFKRLTGTSPGKFRKRA